MAGKVRGRAKERYGLSRERDETGNHGRAGTPDKDVKL
jgi:hypothetical protein